MGILDGKVAIITGAGRGLGRSHARMMAAEGAKVVVNDLGGELDGAGDSKTPAQAVVDEIAGQGGVAVANYDDVASWPGAERLVRQAIDTYGRLDVLVNNAGILRDRMSFNMAEDDWDAVIRVHLKGHFAPTRFACVYWRERHKAGEPIAGRIVNTASEAGVIGNAGQANYSAAKAGILALTMVIAREMERYGVAANAIAPRAVTRMTETLFAAFGDDAMKQLEPQTVSSLVTYLASDRAAHVNGQAFIVYGGLIQLLQGWHPVASVEKTGSWQLADVEARLSELFQSASSKLPPLG
ncbi:MAG TPA: SDR family oxidoreductase [Candidatus Binatia bacterium]|nr:SDR family oxidoreductase [Candidatus Binatia bacterium]